MLKQRVLVTSASSVQPNQFTVKKKRTNIFSLLLNYEGLSLYVELYNTALQNCRENTPANRKIYLSAFPMVIMKKLMMFYSLTQTKTIHPRASRYLEG